MPIGFVYLVSSSQNALSPSHTANDYLHSGELRVGLIIDREYRRKGYAREAIAAALEAAFSAKECARVQAVIVECADRDRALGVFMRA